MVSRKGHAYRRFNDLCDAVAADLEARNAILDGEIVCLDDQGRSRFYDLMFRRRTPYFYVFDLLWLDGEDLRDLSLLERKARLSRMRCEPRSRIAREEGGQGSIVSNEW